MNIQAMVNDMQETAAGYVSALEQLTQRQIDTVPFPGSWTPGQLAEHVLRSVSGITTTVNGKTEATEQAPDARSAMLRSIMLDFSSKLQSPDFILPVETVHHKEQLLHWAKSAFAGIEHAMATLDLTQLCLDFELPNLGKLTRYDWCTFALVHQSWRHLHQLRSMLPHLGVGATA